MLLFHSVSFSFVSFGQAEQIVPSHLCFPLFFSHTGRLLDVTKNYKYIFLLAGSEVCLSALVLGISNFLCMRKKSQTPLEDPAAADGAKLELRGEVTEMTQEEGEEDNDKRAKDVAKEELERGERREEGEEVAAVDSQEGEKFLEKPQQNGEASSNSETRL